MASLQEKIVALEKLERSALAEAWIKAYKTPPFKGARKSTLVRGLAYHAQCQDRRGLRKKTHARLLKIAYSDDLSSLLKGTDTPRTKLGSQLVREWNGRTHTVHVTDQGFVLSGVTYSSLSAVAKAITGAHWSGPRFFGVKA